MTVTPIQLIYKLIFTYLFDLFIKDVDLSSMCGVEAIRNQTLSSFRSHTPKHVTLVMGISATLLPSSLLPHHPKQNGTANHLHLPRRSVLFLSTTLGGLSIPAPLSYSSPSPDTSITDRVFLDFSICPSYFVNRNLGDELALCAEAEAVGRVVLGLYGNLVPITVSNFKAMCTGSSGSSYKGSLVQKIFPGQFFLAGRQGRRDKGEVKPPRSLVRNTETVESKAFLLEHSRPGTLSLCLSENDDDDEVKLNPDYHNVEFLITTGPGPCPQLDSKNIVFGTVVEGTYIYIYTCLSSN